MLYDNECYPQSIFLFQQAIEKALKSIAIWIEITDIENARKTISHRTMEVYKIAHESWVGKLDNLENNREGTDVISKIMGYESINDNLAESREEVQKAHSWVKSYLKKTQKYAQLSHEELNDILSDLKQLEKEYNHELSAKTNFFETNEEWNQFIEETTDIMKKGIEYYSDKYREKGIAVPENLSEMVEDEFEKIFKVTNKDTWNEMGSIMVDTSYAFKSLFHLSVLTEPHASSTRYPNEDFNPMEFYSPNLPLVMELPKFIGIAESIVTILENMFIRIQERSLY